MSIGEGDLANFIVKFFKDMFNRFENLVTEADEYRKLPLISDLINKKKS